MDLIAFSKALEIGLKLPQVKLEVQEVPLQEAHGRILAQDFYAKDPLPRATNSAMDGFGFRLEDLGKTLPIAKTLYAGAPLDTLPPSACVKIMTGALVPSGVEVVVPLEKMQDFNNTHATAPLGFIKGANIRYEGENFKAGDLLLKQGTRLKIGDIALLASQGCATLGVFRKLKVGVFSSGDEVVGLGSVAKKHQVYDTNGVVLVAMLQNLGFEATHLGHLPDDLQEQSARLKEALICDVLISSAGVSVGDKDHFKEALAQMGAKIHYHGVNVKPGKPILCASVGEKLIFGMPGNPLSCVLTFLALVCPVLLKQAGDMAQTPLIKARMANSLNLKGQRTHLILGWLENGIFTPYKDNTYGAGAIDALSRSNAMACVSETQDLLVSLLP
ncbi:molybdopterin molybdotransferase MoeA [Helicobacter ailurogastricus]|uniref:molybdopterin molybdotransferase MoeA n=1 Tax=Helicobacter ailurogastricus TaxID=1578720 RepID=UPI0022BB1F73|nr:molybdopterin molybdotransferase MoeA [Helicobacter ailurogastricus]GLH57455.1 Molybdopterin biosynthesis protein MoeA [Helicobacter ailurogastricus]GLH58827.1 Molybdopterin biosynthesis protein MoeA [Helicobacter ailurogastricus]